MMKEIRQWLPLGRGNGREGKGPEEIFSDKNILYFDRGVS